MLLGVVIFIILLTLCYKFEQLRPTGDNERQSLLQRAQMQRTQTSEPVYTGL